MTTYSAMRNRSDRRTSRLTPVRCLWLQSVKRVLCRAKDGLIRFVLCLCRPTAIENRIWINARLPMWMLTARAAEELGITAADMVTLAPVGSVMLLDLLQSVDTRSRGRCYAVSPEYYYGTLQSFTPEGELVEDKVLCHNPSVSWVRNKLGDHAAGLKRAYGFRWWHYGNKNEIVLLHPTQDVISYVLTVKDIDNEPSLCAECDGD